MSFEILNMTLKGLSWATEKELKPTISSQLPESKQGF